MAVGPICAEPMPQQTSQIGSDVASSKTRVDPVPKLRLFRPNSDEKVADTPPDLQESRTAVAPSLAKERAQAPELATPTSLPSPHRTHLTPPPPKQVFTGLCCTTRAKEDDENDLKPGRPQL